MDNVRKHEKQPLVDQGDKTLPGSKFLWLSGAENIPSKRH
jgi:hypothetical protein